MNNGVYTILRDEFMLVFPEGRVMSVEDPREYIFLGTCDLVTRDYAPDTVIMFHG